MAGESPTDFGFTSQRNERDFGLMDYNARYYSPVLGRFVSPDTIVPEKTSSGGFNRYRYARNNPIKYNDPSGHCVVLCAIAIGAAVGAAIGAGSVALPQMIKNVQQGDPLMADIDPGEVAKAAVIGAVGGAVGVATGGAATGVAATIAVGAGSGAVTGIAERATEGALSGNLDAAEIFDPASVATDAALGGATAGVGYGIGKAIKGTVGQSANEIFYHGTSSVHVPSIKQGINPPTGHNFRGRSQLGDGFYTSQDPVVAQEFANIAARKSGGNPVVLEIGVNNFEQMSGIGAHKSTWWNTPRDLIDNYDYIQAPVSGFPPTAIQTKFNPRTYQDLQVIK